MEKMTSEQCALYYRAQLAKEDKEIAELKEEARRIFRVAERLRDSDNENEISLEENIAGRYMIKVLEGENFQ